MVIGEPVSVCHQWSTTGTFSFCSAHLMVSGSARSPARNSVRNFDKSYLGTNSPLGSCLLDRPERRRRSEQRDHAMLLRSPASRRRHRACRPACPRRAARSRRRSAARRRCRNGRPPSRHRKQPRIPRLASRRRDCAIDQLSATMWPPLSRTTPLGLAGRARRVQHVERIGRRRPARRSASRRLPPRATASA